MSAMEEYYSLKLSEYKEKLKAEIEKRITERKPHGLLLSNDEILTLIDKI